MFISHKNNVIQQIADTEWDCRRKTKGMDKSEYFTWVDSITSGDPPVADYSGETEYTIVECKDENVMDRITELCDYVGELPTVYNIKWSDTKNADGTHFTGDNTAKDKRKLDEEWTLIRRQRDALLAETDWMANSDVTMSAANKTYREKLRDLPSDQSSKKTYADITWPSKP